MDSIYLLDLASRQARWLSARQVAIAGNIANADTPGYRAREVAPFVETLDRTRLAMTATDPGHVMIARATPAEIGTASLTADGTGQAKDSGNTVALETELVKAGQVNRAFSLNTAIVKAFHGMMMGSVKG